MALHLRIASHSEVGLVRKMNQDSGYASPHLLVVADGMGGAAAGDLASAVAIDSIKRLDTPDLLTGYAPAARPPSAESAPTDPADPQPDRRHRADGGRSARPTTVPRAGPGRTQPAARPVRRDGRGGQRPDRRPGGRRLRPGGDGDDRHRRGLRRTADRARAHRRQPGLPAAGRPPRTADPRPQLGAVPRRRRQDLRRRGRVPPASVPAAEGPERAAGQRPRPHHRGAPGRGPAAVLQRRPVRAGRRPADR